MEEIEYISSKGFTKFTSFIGETLIQPLIAKPHKSQGENNYPISDLQRNTIKTLRNMK